MNNKIKILLLLTLFFCQFNVFSQTPNFSGTWVLNFNKSKLEERPNGLTNSIFIIKQEGDVFRLTIYHIFSKEKIKSTLK